MSVPAPIAAVREAFEAMRRRQRERPFTDWPARAQRLRALQSLLLEHGEAIATAIDTDFDGRPREETELLELFPALGALRHALRHGRRWMRPRRGLADRWFLPARTELRPVPLGVVGIVVPWNYPLYLAVGPLVDSLAAGNHVLVKMSELAPHVAELFAELIERYFPGGEVRVVNGDVEVARAFVGLPFDHLLFTGSTAVGHHVMRAAADHLTPVTLELGGKSPALIGPQARLDHAVERILTGKCVNAGQTCIAPDYVLVPRAQRDAFVTLAQRRLRRLYPDFPRNRQYAAVISDGHHRRLQSLRDDAVAGGARAHPLAEAGSGRRMPPTLLTEVDPSSRVMQEEIFGPLLPVLTYDHLDQALDFIAARPHPLALYLFEDDPGTVRHVLERSVAGGVTVNDTLFHIAQHPLPFGGVGASGMGAYHGETGFRTFSKMMPVLHQSRLSGVRLFNPPYGALFERMIRLLLRH